MKATIHFILSEQGRRASLRVGGTGQAKQEMEIEIVTDDLDLFRIDSQGNADLWVNRSSTVSFFNGTQPVFRSYEFDQLPSASELIAYERARRAQIPAIIAKQQAKVEAEQRDAEAKQAEQEAKATQRHAQLAQWVTEFGSANQQERFAAHLLLESEILEVVKARLFAPLSPFPRYQKLVPTDICQCESEWERNEEDEDFSTPHGVSFSTRPSIWATDQEWEVRRQMQAILPEAVYLFQVHTGEASCRMVQSIGILVKIQQGAFNFAQEYQASEPEDVTV